jgi:hypothetical protein
MAPSSLANNRRSALMPQLDDSRGKRHGRLETAPDPNHRGTTIRHTSTGWSTSAIEAS